MRTLTFYLDHPKDTWTNGRSFVNTKTTAIICSRGLKRYIALPDDIKKITVCVEKEDTQGANGWDINREGGLEGVRAGLDCDFRSWLRRSYELGYPFAHVEYWG